MRHSKERGPFRTPLSLSWGEPEVPTQTEGEPGRQSAIFRRRFDRTWELIHVGVGNTGAAKDAPALSERTEENGYEKRAHVGKGDTFLSAGLCADLQSVCPHFEEQSCGTRIWKRLFPFGGTPLQSCILRNA